MKPARRRIAEFALAFLPLLLALGLAYAWVQPVYRGALRSVADPLTGALSRGLAVDATDGGGWRVVRREPDGRRRGVFSIPGSSLKQIHVSLVLLPALLLATPVGMRERLRLCGLGLLLLVAAQLLLHVAFVLGWVRYQDGDPHDPLFRLLVLAHSTSGQVLPAVLWGALTWRHWFPAPESDQAAGGARARDDSRAGA